MEVPLSKIGVGLNIFPVLLSVINPKFPIGMSLFLKIDDFISFSNLFLVILSSLLHNFYKSL